MNDSLIMRTQIRSLVHIGTDCHGKSASLSMLEATLTRMSSVSGGEVGQMVFGICAVGQAVGARRTVLLDSVNEFVAVPGCGRIGVDDTRVAATMV